MTSLKFKIFFLILFSFKLTNSSDFSIGSSCILKSGADGFCEHFDSCSIIKDLWKKKAISRAHITECDRYSGTICCPFSLDNETSKRPTTTTTSTTTQESVSSEEVIETTPRRRTIIRTQRVRTTTTKTTTPRTTQAAVSINYNRYNSNQERISQKKCKEYGKTVWQIIGITPLLGQPPRTTNITKCAHRSVSLIVGGTEASADEFPHQVLLGYSPRNTDVTWACGGSLVSPKFVMTAAHCLFDRQLSIVKKVKVGMRNIDQEHDNKNVFIYNIKETIKHPNHNEKTFNNDIALLKLDGTVPINEHILPICLPTKQHDDYKAIATGFGKTFGNKPSQTLLKVILERFVHPECQQSWPEDTDVKFDEKTMVCYGHHKERKDTCRGDSGGPLQISNENNVHCTYTQIGISSFGPATCGQIGVASSYTNVFNYIDWIENIVWADEK